MWWQQAGTGQEESLFKQMVQLCENNMVQELRQPVVKWAENICLCCPSTLCV